VAWGLASQGIAVLRYDKVTRVHPEKFAGDTELTLDTEYVRDAGAAIRLLTEHPSIDPASVFVLGHSQGGAVAPRIAAAEPTLAGLIMLAGATQPLHHTMVRQLRYLTSLTPGVDVDSDPVVQEVIRQSTLIDSPDFSASTPADRLPRGTTAAYWLDLLAYDPVATAAGLGIPMLILQGGRDYQVTGADDLAGWQTGLADHDDVTIRVYDADNHQFFSGSGPSTPLEYRPAQNVDPAVVTDIADWIHDH
jgi:dienelactone hydrolase